MEQGQNGNGAGEERGPGIRITPEQYEQLRVAARENQRSIAGEARYAISLYLRNIEKRRAAAAS